MDIKDFNFKKNFGQNFIFDDNLLSAIVSDSGITEHDNVLEIGTGAGTLTSKLAKKAKFIVSYEIDKTLTEHLNRLCTEHKNLKIYIKDGLKTPIKEIEKDFNGEKYSVVANIPYYITSPLIFKFIEETDNVKSITVMVQKEVAERLVSKPGEKEYGIPSIMINYYADIKILRTVSRKMFHPMPKVDSALIQIIPNKKKTRAKDSEQFKKLVHAAFSMRRKTLVNNLTKNFKADKEYIVSILNKLGIDLSIRAENLSISDFINLCDSMLKKD